MVPGAVMGIDSKKFLERTEEMVQACASCVPVEENPGVVLGLILGCAAKAGRDKVTIITSPGIHDLGAWLEQLIAESTGKQGKGIIPVDREAIGTPDIYGNDRVFAYLRLESEPDKEQDAKVSALEKAGHPVVRISLTDTYDLGQEFFRWEIATAVAGSIIGINPFNQPDVEASKIVTRNLTNEYEKNGSLPSEKPILDDKGVKLFTRRQECRRTCEGCGIRKIAGRLSQGASRTDQGRRLFRAVGLHPDERRARKAVASYPARGSRQEARGDLPRIRSAVPALNRAGVQGRSELGRVPAIDLRRRERPSCARTEVHLRRS